MNKMDEQIIVVPRKELFESETLTFQGVNSNPDLLNKLVNHMGNNFTVMRRGDAEDNESFKQPIPYAVLKRGNEVFLYERLQGGGEQRLHNQLSLGVGGHANYHQKDEFANILADNLQRELEEELHISNDDFHLKTIGLINDDLNDVGKVHLGVLTVIELTYDTDVTVREVDQLKGGWISIQNLKDPNTYNNLESWSQFVADILNQ